MVWVKVSSLLLFSTLVTADLGFFMKKNAGNLVPKPVGKDPKCDAAYSEHVNCHPIIMQKPVLGTPSEMPSEKQLEMICTDTCLKSLEGWIRGNENCSPADFLKFIGRSNATTKSIRLKDVDLQQFFINEVYWNKCLTDLKPKTGDKKWCILQEEEVFTQDGGTLNTISTKKPEEFCTQSTCGAQNAWLWGPKKVIIQVEDNEKEAVKSGEKGTPKEALITLKQACPKLDTSKFPKRESGIKDAELPVGSNETESGSAVTAENANLGAAPAEAGKGGNTTESSIKINAAHVPNVERGVATFALLVAVLLSFY
ncbi:hypothetical protein H072_6302 [Dactylellina haptotyla CBS 200.50]|uniref:Uncharacterized protein n=1 Tax=Dactylellina haptotyla (strain CBS 200.50) TaxID=1284197 RepID=S8AAI9_DACHA|nr:hypothetical protein H072_6302 [Dactylellina haptotyla CBS 200.50]